MPLFLLKFLPLLFKLKGPAKVAGVFLKGNWKIAAPMLLAVFLLGVLHFQNKKIDKLDAEVVEWVLFAAKASEANSTQFDTIVSLRAANESLAQAVIVSEQVRADAYAAAREREQRARIRLDDTINKLKELENETPECDVLNRIDIGAVCPRSVELLREIAKGPFDTD